jgi:hypothetical protein
MPLFFAYGTELDRARLIAKTLSDTPAAGAAKDANAQSADAAVAPQTAVQHAPLEPLSQPQSMQSETPELPAREVAPETTKGTASAPFYTYATRQSIASGFVVGMSLVFRRRDDDEGELVPDLVSDASAQTWGVVFELADETMDAICARFDEARSCEKCSVDVTKLLSGWKSASYDIADLPGRTVEALCLVAKDKEAPVVDADEKTLRRLLACYAEHEAPLSEIARLLPRVNSSIEGLRKGIEDLAERRVCEIYYKAPPRYAIYRSEERVMVQYADACALADKQRADMVPLNTLRSQISGLIDGWEKSRFRAVADRGKRYNAQVAAALNQRLEGDMTSPQLVLEDIKNAILAERASWGRFQYLIGAFSVAVALCILFWLLKDLWFKPTHSTAGLWLAARAGTVGAFFSIAMNIQERKVLTDLHKRDNLADSALRITVGAIGAAVLLCLLQSGLLPLGALGTASTGAKGIAWEVILVVGFIAGFSERLVPTIVDKMASQTGAAPQKP